MSPQEKTLSIPTATLSPPTATTHVIPTPAPSPTQQHHIAQNLEMQQPPALTVTNNKQQHNPSGYHQNGAYQQHDTDKLGMTKQPSSLSMTITPASNTTTTKEAGDSFDFDDLLPHIGEFGIYQRMLFLCMIPFACYVAWVYFTQIFITLTPEQHWCWVPELANLTREQRVLLAIPQTAEGLEKCRMYAVDYEQILAEGATVGDPSWPTVACLQGWEYNYTDVPYVTIASELDWVCDQAALPSIAQAVFFCGAILGGLVFGWLADRRGRIPALMGSNIVGCVGGIATAFCTSFWGFCMCRFLVGMAFDNCFTMMYILVLEYVGPRWRTFVANMSIAIFFTIAATCLPYLALYVADWRTLCIVTSAPLILAIFTPWVVPESARWLASQGKIEKAVCILRKFERINKTKVDEELYKEFTTSVAKIQKEELEGKSYSVMDLFRTPRLRNITILLILIWMAISLVFDGHVRNVGSLGLDIFLTFAIASATEFPADTFLTLVLDRWGRRWLACGTMVASGVFSLLATTVPVGIPSATLAIVGRFAVNISYNIGLQYAAELLPTVVRAQGVALIHIMGYVASIVAPFVVYLGNISSTLPLLILGGLGIVGGILALFLPETLGQELPQTLQDGEQFGMNQRFFEFPCCGKKHFGSDDDSTASISQAEQQPVERFRRTNTSAGSSFRGSFRGEVRSTLIHRTSTRQSNRSVGAGAVARGSAADVV